MRRAAGRLTLPAVDIREIGPDGFDQVWPVFHAVVSAADTFSYDPQMSLEEARAMWTAPPSRAFAAVADDRVVGCYALRPNQQGPGAHVANGSYMVAPDHRGRGVASALCAHSLETARAAGFLAMQFNAVVATNAAAVHVWRKHGFAVVGRIPAGFRHPELGFTDLLVMHRFLT